jgi:hypothetical protein
MPGGVPVGTLAIGKAGATNAALLAVAILALTRPELAEKLSTFRDEQTASVRSQDLPPSETPPLTRDTAPPPARVTTCSFCGKSSHQVGAMVEGPADVYICTNCVTLAAKIFEEMRGGSTGEAGE